MNAPCKDCPDRVLGCHSTCEKYKAFQTERDRELEKRMLEIAGNPLNSKYYIQRSRIKQKIARCPKG